MAAIEVETVETDAARSVFRVTVRGGGAATEHKVTLENGYFALLALVDERPEEFVRRCFEFLLEREGKESILRSFDVSVIARYFGEFERTIARAGA